MLRVVASGDIDLVKLHSVTIDVFENFSLPYEITCTIYWDHFFNLQVQERKSAFDTLRGSRTARGCLG